MTGERITILVDSREQRPYLFERYPVDVVRGALATGDYSIPGGEALVAIERKELSDLMNCLTHDRARFTRELQRLTTFHFGAVIVEASAEDVSHGRYRSAMTPAAAVASICALWGRFKIPFVFAGDRTEAERLTFQVLRRFTVDIRAVEDKGDDWPEPYSNMARSIAERWKAVPESPRVPRPDHHRRFVGCGIPRAMAGPDESGGHTLDHPPANDL